MRVKFDTFTTAVCKYIDTDIINKAPRNRRLLLGVAVMATPNFLSKKCKEHCQLLSSLGIIDEDNKVDLDSLESVGTELMDKYGSYQMKILDMEINITKDDISRLCQMCRNME